ncbi:hypothetical protein HPP92_021054 [Vanilla planifolia]|uniref:Uncharacterized protein n=1 Tax=Vanilla planifolia TaxID=51239 RepID=A0A835Q0B2_VANPL|nr:hypothetical protein HPP92_021054 [Vanilla planifolia]
MGQCASRRSATPGSEPLAVRRSASERLGWIAAAREQRSRLYSWAVGNFCLSGVCQFAQRLIISLPKSSAGEGDPRIIFAIVCSLISTDTVWWVGTSACCLK